MKAYYDESARGNMWQYSDQAIKNWLTFDNWSIKTEFLQAKWKVVTSQNYASSPGIYMVSVRGDAELWLGLLGGDTDKPNTFDLTINLFDKIPEHVITAVKNRELIFVVDQQAEGRSFFTGGQDSYRVLHDSMNKIGLPPMSVIVMSGNKDLPVEYNDWLISNNEQQMFEHVLFLSWADRAGVGLVLDHPLVLDAMKDSTSKDYLSMNRNPRPHRVDHLFTLLDRDLVEHGLVSGHYVRNITDHLPSASFVDTHWSYFRAQLVNNLPLILDGNWTDNDPNRIDTFCFPADLYKKSLLSFVTESEFSSPGLFATEKIFKPLRAGHPFILLGQRHMLQMMRDLGYNVDFYGIDNSYDIIDDPIDRFEAAHAELVKWINLSREDKIFAIEQSMDAIQHNFDHFKSQTYRLQALKDLKDMATKLLTK